MCEREIKRGREKNCFFTHKANPAVVSCLENERHGLEDGDGVLITEVKGMEAINNTKPTIKGK